MNVADLPLGAKHREAGAIFGERGAWRVPLSYGNARSEHDAVRHQAGVRDLTMRARLRLTGSDRATWLHNICTQSIRTLQPGQGAYATCINDVGRLMFDFVVYVRPDELLLELDGALREKALGWLDHYLITEEVTIEDVSETYLAVELAGPTSATPVGELPREPFGVTDSEGVLLLGSHGVGVPAWQLWARPGRIESLWSELAAGARPYGEEAWDMLRIEAGTPIYGIDMGEDNNPLESGLNAAISYDKGCYTGQEVIARLTFRQGPVRVFMGLKSLDGTLLVAGEELAWEGKTMARVTSSTMSPTRGIPIALGYVRRECKTPGTQLQRSSGGVVEVVDLPWV